MPPVDRGSSVRDVPPPRGIPSILFSSTLRLFLLRLILVTGTLSLASEISQGKYLGAGIFGMTVLHHLLSAFGPRYVPLFTWLDLISTLGEVGFGIFSLTFILPYFPEYRWYPKRVLGGIFGVLLLTIALTMLLFIKILQLVDARGSTFFQRLDILRDRGADAAGHDRLKRIDRRASRSWWRYPAQVLFGRKIWERRLPGELFWISLLRGFLALVVISSLAVFGFFQIVLQPVGEMGLTPNKVLRGQALSGTFRTTTPILWNVIVVWTKRINAPQTLRESLTLEPLWPMTPSALDEWGTLYGPNCTAKEANSSPSVEVVIFSCRPRIPIPEDQECSFRPFQEHRQDMRPNILLTANFTRLMGPEQLPNTRADMIFDSLQVYLALTNDTDEVLMTTRPTPLFPGSNLLGIADLMIRQRLKPYWLSTLGLFDLYDTFMIADIPSTAPEPWANSTLFTFNNGSFPAGPNISTLRIACQDDAREWTVIQDYRSKTVMGGIAAVGGLGSFLSVLFLLLFGNSLLALFYRTKPLTPFGIFHNLENQRSSLSTSTHETYHNLRSDLKDLEDRKGLWTFVLDTFFDLSVITGERLDDQLGKETQVDDVESGRNGEKHNTDPNEGVVVQGLELRRTNSYQSSIQGNVWYPRARGEGSETDTDAEANRSGESGSRRSLDVPLLGEDAQKPWVAWSKMTA